MTIPDKLSASWIQEHIKNIIHHDQMGFTAGMQAWFNICKSIIVKYHINKMNDKNQMVTLIDAEMAVDTVYYPFL